MILSHDWRFLFLKTRKTAGTSVEIALSRICGPLDVITPISPADQAQRNKDSGTLPRNYLLGGIPAPPPGAAPEAHFAQHMQRYQPRAQLLNHARLADDLALLAKTLGWPDLGALPRAKSHTRRGRHIDWSAADRAYVHQAFAAEVALYEQVRQGYFRERLQAAASR